MPARPPQRSAQQERLEAAARERSRENRVAALRRVLLLSIALLAIVAFLVYAWQASRHRGQPAAAPSAQPYTPSPDGPTLSTAPPPWVLPADAQPYIQAAGLQALPQESLAVHYHAHLDVLADGRAVTVPAQLGYVFSGGQPVGITSLHTHDASGVLHVEAPADTSFTLGQLTTEWGVRLTPDCLGGLCSGNGKTLRAYVNGMPWTGDPASIVLRPHQEIALVYGDSSATAKPPSTYHFPRGL